MEIRCHNCRYFKPHEIYGTVGLCTNRDGPFYDRLVMTEWQCPFFVELNINEEEFYWCQDCRVVFHVSMIEMHRNHKIAKLPYVEEESYLETYAAD
ncbi:hypothetical protein [Vulcanisaeta thermophila]|uniref:hypothetical protein n=1 Tax=Vulcanisaeta thermophila TaxID=867917 RepID=UPI000852BF0E|nr:hypothetical protein [Vulcanisaeta thermophila]